jgi:hypothetical protein
MTKSAKITTQDRINLYQQKIKDLKLKLKGSTSKLNKDSEGMTEALNALNFLVTTHKVSMGQVIKTISGIKRTGLRIEDPAPKTKKAMVI